jgi:hypothetical protein
MRINTKQRISDLEKLYEQCQEVLRNLENEAIKYPLNASPIWIENDILGAKRKLKAIQEEIDSLRSGM